MSETPDLMEALRLSLAAAKDRRQAAGSAVEVLTSAGWQIHSRFVTRDEAQVKQHELAYFYPEYAWRVVSL